MKIVIIGLIIIVLVTFVVGIAKSDSASLNVTSVSIHPCNEAKPVPKPKTKDDLVRRLSEEHSFICR